MAIAMTAVWLSSCDSNLFGPQLKEIAGGYQLKNSNNSNEFALTIPNQSGGLIIDEIGWRKPFIIARASGSQYWDVINTSRAQHTRISDPELKSNPDYQSIETKGPDAAWNDLTRHSPIW